VTTPGPVTIHSARLSLAVTALTLTPEITSRAELRARRQTKPRRSDPAGFFLPSGQAYLQ
jgi:hypothetical protein